MTPAPRTASEIEREIDGEQGNYNPGCGCIDCTNTQKKLDNLYAELVALRASPAPDSGEGTHRDPNTPCPCCGLYITAPENRPPAPSPQPAPGQGVRELWRSACEYAARYCAEQARGHEKQGWNPESQKNADAFRQKEADFYAARDNASGIPLDTSGYAQWRDIASAPKDGSQFLIWTRRLRFAVVTHDVDEPMPTDIVPSGHYLVVDDGKHGPYPIRGDYPTHWMPLPSAPGALSPPDTAGATREGDDIKARYLRSSASRDKWITEASEKGAALAVAKGDVAGLREALTDAVGILDHIYERTYCGADAQWHFKEPYDPQVVIDALERIRTALSGPVPVQAQGRGHSPELAKSLAQAAKSLSERPVGLRGPFPLKQPQGRDDADGVRERAVEVVMADYRKRQPPNNAPWPEMEELVRQNVTKDIDALAAAGLLRGGR